MIEALPIIIMCLLFTVPWALKKQWWWLGFWVTLCLLLGIWEATAYFMTGETLSQKFWAFSQEHPTSAIGIMASVTVGYIILLVHLFAKLGEGKKE